MLGRTDLAMEFTDQSTHTVEKQGECTLTRLEYQGEQYITLEVPAFSDHPGTGTLEELTAKELRKLLPEQGTVLVVGIGNRAITPDALGPEMADQVLATRHIRGELARVAGLESLRPVAVLAPGVLGCTGMESGEIVKAMVRQIQPCAVIAADALASRSLERLGCTVQLSTAGLSPGQGVGNPRPDMTRQSLGVPVISMGIPTVVDASLLAYELLGRDAGEAVAPRGEAMVVTPREIDLLISRGARALAMAVNRALNPSLEQDDFQMLLE